MHDLAVTPGRAQPSGLPAIDLNSDLGEGYGVWQLGDDDAMLGIVTSANIACGFHAGDPLTLRRTVEAAVTHGVVVGAQVGYPDLLGFGRRFLDIDPAELAAGVIYQIGALDGLARAAGGAVQYVKPHGALYNAVVHHEAQAAAVVDGVLAFDDSLAVLGLPGSRWLALAEAAGLRPVREAFADRAYSADGTLVPRGEPGAVLTDEAAVVDRCVRLATAGEVVAADGTVVRVDAESLCLHGDTPGAVRLVRAVRTALAGAGIGLAPFTGAG
jgi:UPF0271 protein